MTNKKDIEKRVFDEVLSQGKLELIPELFAPGWKPHDPGPPTMEGRVRAFREAMPDLRYTILDMVEDGDRVAVRWTARGTHRGPLFGIPATGRALEVTGVIIDRFEGSKIAEHWSYWDRLDLMQQLGVIPKTP